MKRNFERPFVLIMLMLAVFLFTQITTFAASSSVAYAKLYFGGNKYYIFNNTWGSAKAPGGSTESVYCNSASDMGWNWNWGMQNPYDVKAYPSIVCGWHWTNGYETGTGLPVQLSSTKKVNTSVSYSLSNLSSGSVLNFAYDIWLHSINNANSSSTPTDEVMIWLNSTGGAGPLGTLQETVSIAGASWKVYKGNTGWNVFSFVRTSNTGSAGFNVKDFTAYLVNKGWMSSTRYISSVEAGDEIFLGSGSCKITNFSVTVQ